MDKKTKNPNCDMFANKLGSEKMNISYSEYVGNTDCKRIIRIGNISKYGIRFEKFMIFYK